MYTLMPPVLSFDTEESHLLVKDNEYLWWPNIHMSLEEALGKVLRVAYKLASEILTKKINAWSEIQRISMIFWSFGTPSYTLNTPILKY